MNRHVLIVCASLALATALGPQQPTPHYRIEPLSDLTGIPGLSLALRKLATVGTLMQTTAHPDDENNAMLALYARHLGMRVTLVTATRGDGGQNEIGPELFDALGILRTEELLAAHRFDGAEQYFTRAVDFGYTFSQEETFDKWGRDEILGDFVRHIRAIRPDVISTLGVDGAGGGQHHQVSAIITAEAFQAAADPARYPEQIRDGLRPWQAKKLYRVGGGPGAGRGGRGARGRANPPSNASAAPTPNVRFATLDINVYEPLLGCTIGEIGNLASGMHICQGRVPAVGTPGAAPPFGARFRLVESLLPPAANDESSLFEGVDTSIAGLARYAGPRPPSALGSGLAAIAARVDAATRALEGRGPAAVVPELAAGLAAVRALRTQLPSIGLADEARYEIDFRLKLEEDRFQQALVLAHALRIEALANDGLVVAGQPVNVSVVVANRSSVPLDVRSVALRGFETPAGCAAGKAAPAGVFTCVSQVRIPGDARLTGPYWDRPDVAGRAVFAADVPFGVPFRPTPFVARIDFEINGVPVAHELPVQFRYETVTAGERRMELKVVPAFAVEVTPRIAVLPLRPQAGRTAGRSASRAAGREVRVTVTNGTKGPATASVRVDAPDGWRATPASASLAFTREDEAITTRFMVAPPQRPRAGASEIRARVAASGMPGAQVNGVFAEGVQAIEYPHIQRRHRIVPATAAVRVLDAAIAPALAIGYIVGVGDQVPAAIQQLGAKLTFIDEDELAWGDLSKYHTILTGVRAYERRDDLRANNHRLLEYVEKGGTVVVQYNKMEFNRAQYGPYRATVGTNRITDETAPVKVLQPAHLLFRWPNRIDESAWHGWVQERGLYFLGERDERYVDLVEMEDPFEFNKGPKRGALVEARFGKGRWIYVGLGLWRQLPAGTEGAYKLLANLISIGSAPASRRTAARD